eukprot:TRINITY_DN61872_c0_g1_i1.p1 TRINITY_DN61872_c0_g1~~TRINITY_DN61872_c0_g1_i1.p1  ORF type:complete len:473 (+),score=91.22 TRINITY_DN61872_c0_g1_i1:43-1461(+)
MLRIALTATRAVSSCSRTRSFCAMAGGGRKKRGRGGEGNGDFPPAFATMAMGLTPRPVMKKQVEEGASVDGGDLAFGVASMQGWRENMEDAHLALPDFDAGRRHGLFGVFDGHGGSAVAELVAERLPGTLRNLPEYKSGDYEKAFATTFLKLDQYLDSPAGRKDVFKRSSGEGPEGMGCTAVVALVRHGGATSKDAAANGVGDRPELVVANAGDSRCVLVGFGDKGKAFDMSRDHAPTLPDEGLRIRKAGGFVTGEGRVNGNLNLSRALGDLFYKKNRRLKPEEQLISGVPEVRRRTLRPGDRFLVIGCDGIWERVSSQACATFLLSRVDKRPTGCLADACADFLDKNVSPNPIRTGGLGCDNMTLMMVDLASVASETNGKAAPRASAASATTIATTKTTTTNAAVTVHAADTADRVALGAKEASVPALAETDNAARGRRSTAKRVLPSFAWFSRSKRRRIMLAAWSPSLQT